ncbi:MAG: hypothetical protein IT440_05460 [Phycisphaeraceae bacterium]|nr:hypothetical protein [Phycisphaeraceae bacterium]
MRLFTDNAGRQWTVVINVDTIKRVRGLVGVNLLEVIGPRKKDDAEGDLLSRLSSDPILLCDVLYAVCKPEADTRNVTDEDFGRAMAGDAIDQATTALLEELVGFFPQSKRRVLGKALTRLRDLESRVLDVAERRLDDLRIEAAMEEALREMDAAWLATPSGSSGNLPASSASIPVPGP